MDSLEYEVLSYLDAGRSMFRPRVLSRETQEAFVEVLGLLLRLRRVGHVEFADNRISRTQGTYLALGPVDLTPAGRAALAQDWRRAQRSGRSYDRSGGWINGGCFGTPSSGPPHTLGRDGGLG
jgi:hypothetical protein